MSGEGVQDMDGECGWSWDVGPAPLFLEEAEADPIGLECHGKGREL